MAVLLIQDVNSAILSHLSPTNDVTKNCKNGLLCLIIFLFSSPRFICRTLFGQAALGTRRLLRLLSGFDVGIRINLGYLWQSCIALRRSLQGLWGDSSRPEPAPGLGPLPVHICGESYFQDHLHLRNTVSPWSPVCLSTPPLAGSEPVLICSRTCLPGWGGQHMGLWQGMQRPSCVRAGAHSQPQHRRTLVGHKR